MPPFDLRLEKNYKTSGLLLVTCAVLLTGIYKADGFMPRYAPHFQRTTRRVKLCGSVLADMVDFRCAGRGLFRGKKSSGDMQSSSKDHVSFTDVSMTTPNGIGEKLPLDKDLPWLDKTKAFSFLTTGNHDVNKRSIVQECCVKGCTLTTLERYCNKAGKRSDHHIFGPSLSKPWEQTNLKVADSVEPSRKEGDKGEKKTDDNYSPEGLQKSSNKSDKLLLSGENTINPIKSSQSLQQRQPSWGEKTRPGKAHLSEPQNKVEMVGLLKLLTQMTSTHFKMKHSGEN